MPRAASKKFLAAMAEAREAERKMPDPRLTNAGVWSEWIDALQPSERMKVFSLAAAILPSLCTPIHTRDVDMGNDDAAISSALRIAQRFYARIGTYGSKEKP